MLKSFRWPLTVQYSTVLEGGSGSFVCLTTTVTVDEDNNQIFDIIAIFCFDSRMEVIGSTVPTQ